MKAKLETDEGRKVYRLRQQTVKPIFGTVKFALGFREFRIEQAKSLVVIVEFRLLFKLRPTYRMMCLQSTQRWPRHKTHFPVG